MPALIDQPLAMVGTAAAPLAMIVLGMGLAEYGIREGWQISTAITAVKLLVQPLVVWLLASLAVGANVYLMARQFKVLEGPVAGSLLLSTMLSALTTPLIVSLMG